MNCEYSGNVPLFNEFSSLNSILMATLYSENSRNLIIKNAKNWDSSNKYKSLIKKIVNKNKRKNDISKEISLLNPDEIFLENMYFLKDKDNQKKFVNDIKTNKLEKLIWSDDFIIDFYRSLGLSYLDIYNDGSNHYLNLYKFISWKLSSDNKYTTELNLVSMIKYKEENIIPANPDILIVFNNINEKYIKPFSFSKETGKFLNNNLKSLNINFNQFENIQEEVKINEETYILDSILLRIGDKSIVGFRCDGEKYVYNNFSSTYDSPCSVIKFDWKYNEGEFCYNPIKCKLEDDEMRDINDLCFNFNNGNKTFIYIKKDKIPEFPEIPDIPDSEIIKIIKMIKEMDVMKLTEFIKTYDQNIIQGSMNKISLEKIALKIYMINFTKLFNQEPEAKPEVEKSTE